MKKIIFGLSLWIFYICGTSVHAEVKLEKILHTSNFWQVVYREWSDGLNQCVAENIQGNQVKFDLVVAENSISFGIYIGENATRNEKEHFSFRVDNNAAWTSDTPMYEDGWLTLELADVSDNVFFEIERQFRKGMNFIQLDTAGNVTNKFSLIGSNAAIIALAACEDKYVATYEQSSISEPNEKLMGVPNENFEIGYESYTDEIAMTEFVPVGETVQKWSRMITIQSLIGYRPKTLESFARKFTQLVINQCSTSDHEIIWRNVQYGYNSMVLAVSCHENLVTGLSEHMLVKVIQGDDALYVVQKAWKYEPNDDQLNNWFEEMGSFIVCGKNNDFKMCT